MSLKVQDRVYGFKHGLLQTYLMFIGKYINLLMLSIPLILSTDRRRHHFVQLKALSETKHRKLRYTKLLAAFPALLDSMGSGMMITSLLLLPASIALMLQGGQIVMTCAFSKWINNRSILKHHILGVIFSSVGFVVVGLAGFMSTGDQALNHQYTVGGFILSIVIIIINLILQAVQSNIEEKICTKNAIPAKRMVGLEGLFGLIWMFGVITALSYIPCPSQQLCDIRGYTTDPVIGVTQIINTLGLMFWCAVTVFAVVFVNMNAMILIQKVSATFRIFWSNTTCVFVWIICLLIGYEKFVLIPFLIQLAGFSLLITGNFTYNEIIKWRCLNRDKQIPINSHVVGYSSIAKPGTNLN